MKKSEVYRKAIFSVMDYKDISQEDKLVVLKELINDEEIALYCEKQEEKKA